MSDKPTPARIAHHYKAMQDSVTALNAGKPSTMLDAQWVTYKANNVAHLEHMKAITYTNGSGKKQSYWTTEDMTAVDKAIADHK